MSPANIPPSPQEKEICRLQGVLTFWKIEAEQWRKLFEEQRGGEAFNSIQKALADARAEIDTLKRKKP